jgi:hypothetical protein
MNGVELRRQDLGIVVGEVFQNGCMDEGRVEENQESEQ